MQGGGGGGGRGGGGGGQDDFFDQMLSTLPAAWPELGTGKSPWELHAGASEEDHPAAAAFDGSALLVSRLRQHQIGGGGDDKPVMLHLSDLHGLAGAGGGGEDAGASGFLPLPLFTDRAREEMDAAAFKSPNAAVRFFIHYSALCSVFCLPPGKLPFRAVFCDMVCFWWGFVGSRAGPVQRVRSRRDACRRRAAAVRTGTAASSSHQDTTCTPNYPTVTLLLHSWRWREQLSIKLREVNNFELFILLG
jgi:hypothetical protein